jgi:hypothetical protein
MHGRLFHLGCAKACNARSKRGPAHQHFLAGFYQCTCDLRVERVEQRLSALHVHVAGNNRHKVDNVSTRPVGHGRCQKQFNNNEEKLGYKMCMLEADHLLCQRQSSFNSQAGHIVRGHKNHHVVAATGQAMPRLIRGGWASNMRLRDICLICCYVLNAEELC